MKYSKLGILDLDVNKLPSLEPVLLSTQGKPWLKRVRAAASRRRFLLTEDWAVTISNCKASGELNGELLIPRCHKRRLQEFDGASVPCPWVVSLLSMGILRPLGVMLVASIIHDFAIEHGYLLFRREKGGIEKRSVHRSDADRLFRDVVSTVNGLSGVGWIGYVAVRLGCLAGVKYAGRRWRSTALH